MSCKIVFKKEHQKNDSVDRNEKLLYATVYDNNGNVSKLWNDLKSLPFIKNLEEVESLMLNSYKKGFIKESFIKYEDRNEPKLFFISSKNNIFDNYKDSLVDSDTGEIEIGFLNNNYSDLTNSKTIDKKDFTPIMIIDSNSNIETKDGLINNLIKINILSGKQVSDDKGYLKYEPFGEDSFFKTFNGNLAYNQAITNYNKDEVIKDSLGNIQFIETKPLLWGLVNKDGKLETLEETIDRVKKNGYDDLVERTSPEEAADIITTDFILSGDYERILKNSPLLEKTNLKDLRDKLFNIINKLGIQLISIEEYKNNYSSKFGIEPNVKALSDLSNGIIALSEKADINDLSEELSHFLVETIDSKELSNLLNDFYITDSLEYKKSNEHYREIYSKQNLSEEELETKVRKEVLGKILSDNIIEKYQKTENENEKNFLKKLIDSIKNIIDKLKLLFKNPKIQIEIQDVVNKLSDEVISEKLNKLYDINEISKKYSFSNPIYYSSVSDKQKLNELEDLLKKLNNRYEVAKSNNTKNLNSFYQNLVTAKNALLNGYQSSAIKIMVSETENLVKQVENNFNLVEKNKKEVSAIKNDNNFLKEEIVPAIEDLRNIINDIELNDEFNQEDKNLVLKQIDNIVKTQSLNNTRYNKIIKIGNDKIFIELAKKYGVNEDWFPYIVASLISKQDDISGAMRYFGNPEHASNPIMGLLAKILMTNKVKAQSKSALYTKELQKFIDENNISQSDYNKIIEKDDDGNLTYNFKNAINIYKAENERNKFETNLYNSIVFDNESDYVTEEEYRKKIRKNGEEIKSITEINSLDKQFEFDNKMREWSEEFENKPYLSHIYRQISAEQQALRMSNNSKNISSAIMSDKTQALLKLTDKNSNYDPSKGNILEEVKADINDANNRMKDVSSPYDANTGDTYFEISKTEKDIIEYSFKDKDNNIVHRRYEIPKPIFIGNYSKYNDVEVLENTAPSQIKTAYDLTRRRLLNGVKYENEKRTINQNYLDQINNIENYYAKEKGFSNFEEFLKKTSGKEREEVFKNINKALKDFTEINGGIGFNEDFYKDIANAFEGKSNIDRLDYIINNSNDFLDSDVERAIAVKKQINERTEILKKYRSKFNAVEIESQGSVIPASIVSKIKLLDESIDSQMRYINKAYKVESNYNNSIANSSLNESFYKDFKDSGLGIVEFMLLHTKNSNQFKFIKNDFKEFANNNIGNTSYRLFLKENNFLNNDGTINTDYINSISTNAGLENIISKFLKDKVYSYYKRFAPNGYENWINDLNDGIYKNAKGENTSFGNFLRNMVEKQNEKNYVLQNDVEKYIKINPSLQYSDGSSESFKDQINTKYNKDIRGRQYKIEKFGNDEFFRDFNIDKEHYSNNPELQEDILQEKAQTNKELALILKLRDLNKLAYDMYNVDYLSPYRIARTRMTHSEEFRKLNKPLDRLKASWNTLKRNVDTQDEGAMDENGNAIKDISKNSEIRVLPKYGLYDLEDMTDMSTDVVFNTIRLISSAIEYDIKKNNMDDIFKLESMLEQQDFSNGKKGIDTNTYKMFKEFIDSQYYGIMRNQKIETTLFGKKIDLTRWISAIDRFSRYVNTSWNPAIAITGLASASIFGLTEGLVEEHLSRGSLNFALGELSKEMTGYIGELGKMDRTSKAYVTARLLGMEGFDALHNASASGRNRIERILKHPGHKIAEMLNNHLSPEIAYAMLYDTRFYNGRWLSFNEFRNKQLMSNNKSKEDIKNLWLNLKDNSLYNNYEIKNEKLEISEKGISLMRNYYNNLYKDNTNSEEELNNAVDKAIENANKDIFLNVSTRTNSLHSFLEGRVRSEMASSATRNPLINPFLAHRNWFTNAVQKKFKRSHFNFISGQYETGNVHNIIIKNPFIKIFNTIKGKDNNKFSISDILSPKISDEQKRVYDTIKDLYGKEKAKEFVRIAMDVNGRSLRRMGIEFGLLGALLLVGKLVAFFTDDPDKKDDFATQYFGYLYFRLASEYGSSNIITGAVQTVDMVNRPAIMFNVFNEAVNEKNWSLKPTHSGAYKGVPKIITAILKQTPLRNLYDLQGVQKKSQMFRLKNSASMLWLLEYNKREQNADETRWWSNEDKKEFYGN